MDRLHEMRREEEEKRIREGISMTEWLRRVNIEADAAMARIAEHEQTPVARDEPATQPARKRRTRKPQTSIPAHWTSPARSLSEPSCWVRKPSLTPVTYRLP